jgi:alkylated DNA nucleotide flippase Atl1
MLVGLNWYLSEDESHNADGKHVSYLDRNNRLHAGLASCDGDLIQRLADVVRRGRSVHALEESGALPAGAPTYAARLRASFTLRDRDAWHREALERLAVADVVFADPDNGMRSNHTGARLEKYALMHELADYARRGQALVVYHHADRSASATDQAKRRLNDLAEATSQQPIAVVIARRGSCRLFVVTASPFIQDRLAQSIRRFATRWSAHTTLVLPGSGEEPSEPSTPRRQTKKIRATSGDAERDEIRRLIESGIPSAHVARRLRIPTMRVAAIKAHMTMGTYTTTPTPRTSTAMTSSSDRRPRNPPRTRRERVGAMDFATAERFIAAIPRGRWSAYKDVATAAGSERGAMAVGEWLRRNGDRFPHPWRVLRSDGSIAIAYYATDPDRPGDASTAREMLMSEGIQLDSSGRALQRDRFSANS